MRVDFVKMHGLGNDFVVIDGRHQSFPEMTPGLACAVADRHLGVGCDQLILLGTAADADLSMRIFNPDGGEAEACGNATRAVALLCPEVSRIATRGGRLTVRRHDAGIAVAMGAPRFGWQDVPLAYAMDAMAMPVSWEGLENPVAVNVGNPHVVFFVDDASAVELARLGPVIEHDPLFPQGVNVNIAQVVSRQRLTLRVWERGAGMTRACGTGACASAAAAMARGLIDREVTVALPGGELTIGWPRGGELTMTGPAAESFRGSFDPADFSPDCFGG